MNIHREYTTKREDEAHLHSITPVSSLASEMAITGDDLANTEGRPSFQLASYNDSVSRSRESSS
jgi:hypothetical protein